MPAREHYEQNDGQAQVGSNTLLAMIGHSKSLTSGWTGFAVKTLMVSSSAATVFGLASWMLLHGPLGPCLSFMGGSGFGFIGGLVSRWRTDVAEALELADRFPLLFEHHIRISEVGRPELRGRDYAEWSSDLRRNPRKQGLIVAAMYSAAPALERIRQEEEDALVAAYASRAAEALSAAAGDDGQGE